jgi:predicted PurR-regulated permease PerM
MGLVLFVGIPMILAGVRSISDIIGPVFLALVITISLHPIGLWLESQHRLPGWAASIVMLVSACGLLVVLTLALVVAVARLADRLPQSSSQISDSAENPGNSLPREADRA